MYGHAHRGLNVLLQLSHGHDLPQIHDRVQPLLHDRGPLQIRDRVQPLLHDRGPLQTRDRGLLQTHGHVHQSYSLGQLAKHPLKHLILKHRY